MFHLLKYIQVAQLHTRDLMGTDDSCSAACTDKSSLAVPSKLSIGATGTTGLDPCAGTAALIVTRLCSSVAPPQDAAAKEGVKLVTMFFDCILHPAATVQTLLKLHSLAHDEVGLPFPLELYQG